MDSPSELEFKLSIAPADVPALRAHPLIAAHAVGRADARLIANRYFDTPERALAAHGMALRLRRIGRQWLQTLKTAGDTTGAMSARGEWEMPVAGAHVELDALRATPLARIATPEDLAPNLANIFSTDFRRESLPLAFDDGTRATLAIDVGSIRCGRGRAARSAPICEIEIELEHGDPRTVLRLVRRLARDIALIPNPLSKAARGHALADGSVRGPAKLRAITLTPETPVCMALRDLLRAGLHALLVNAEEMQRSDDAEYVHQARVALRRMRSALRAHRALLGLRRVGRVDVQLRTIATALGSARNWDVLCDLTLELLAQDARPSDTGTAFPPDLHAAADRQRMHASQEARIALVSRDFGRAMLALETLVLDLDDSDTPPCGAVAQRVLKRQHAKVRRLGRRLVDLDETGRHRLRIAVKRLRYLLDLYALVFAPSAVQPYREATSALQDALGTLNDLAVAPALIEQLGAPQASLAAQIRAQVERMTRARLPQIAALIAALELTAAPWDAPRGDSVTTAD